MQEEYIKFKKLLEYFVSHLEWVQNKNSDSIDYVTYIKPLLDKGIFKRTGQGYHGANIQKQIKDWDIYSNGKICINIQPNFGSYISVKCYLNWLHTGINVLAKWEDGKIVGLYQDEFIYWEKPTIRVNSGKEFTLEELQLFEEDKISDNLKDFFDTFKNRHKTFLDKEEKEKLMENIYKAKDILLYKKQIILQGPPGTGKTSQAKLIASEMIGLKDEKELDNHEQFKLVQFHPSYSYEDFVRGIISKPNESGNGILFDTENKILAQFAELAHKNYLLSQKNNEAVLLEDWINESFEEFKAEIEASIQNEEFNLSGNIGIFKVESDCLKYGSDWKYPSRINNVDFKKLIKARIKRDLSLDQNQITKSISVHAHYRFTYYLALLRIFFQKYNFTKLENKIELKKYVLIIDEINRANLPSVLGELIYALEYRGEALDAMYNLENGNKIILPPNLFIIGTMNTADRSVGHIDYAIRRRFAFINVPSENLKITQGLENFDEELFKAVEELFDENLSLEFNKDDVQLGHSYFIDKSNEEKEDERVSMETRLNYEIRPILFEYVKDGILIGKDIIDKIEQLETSI